MTIKVLPHHIIDILKALPESGGVEFALLKLHLLIEEVLTEMIYLNHENNKYIDDAELTFSQKYKLARASNKIHGDEWVWKALKLLNQARNELAHNLTEAEIKIKLDLFISHVKKSASDDWHDDLIEGKFTRFHMAAILVFVVLSTTVDFTKR